MATEQPTIHIDHKALFKPAQTFAIAGQPFLNNYISLSDLAPGPSETTARLLIIHPPGLEMGLTL